MEANNNFINKIMLTKFSNLDYKMFTDFLTTDIHELVFLQLSRPVVYDCFLQLSRDTLYN